MLQALQWVERDRRTYFGAFWDKKHPAKQFLLTFAGIVVYA